MRRILSTKQLSLSSPIPIIAYPQSLSYHPIYPPRYKTEVSYAKWSPPKSPLRLIILIPQSTPETFSFVHFNLPRNLVPYTSLLKILKIFCIKHGIFLLLTLESKLLSYIVRN